MTYRVLTRIGLVLGTLVLIATTACRPPSAPASAPIAPAPTSGGAGLAHDFVASPVVVPEEQNAGPQRIVSLAPMATEICCALGLLDRLIGRTRYCDYPPAVAAVAPLGALNELNVEVLVTLKPDLILISGTSRAISDRLRPLNLTCEWLPDNRLEDVFDAMTRVGELCGRPKTARRLCAAIREDLAAIATRYRPATPSRVLLFPTTLTTPPTPPYAAGPGSFYADLIALAGHKLALNDTQQPWGPLSLEYILSTDPDVLIELDPDGASRPGGDADALAAWSRVGDLKAVRERRVRVLRGGQHYLPGPRVAHTFEAICRAISEPPR
ncbi:Vitamin B12-binding protein precursor [Phycisphaerae bacterium RAS1]|nr:Vitamin B12-binding protein precursor [Phycisphaerae bacterium RAS1]